jgi:hypothetical protein
MRRGRRLCELCRVLLSRAQPAHPLRDELAFRGHGREAGGRTRRSVPPAARQRAAAQSEVARGIRLLSGLMPRRCPIAGHIRVCLLNVSEFFTLLARPGRPINATVGG